MHNHSDKFPPSHQLLPCKMEEYGRISTSAEQGAAVSAEVLAHQHFHLSHIALVSDNCLVWHECRHLPETLPSLTSPVQ